MESDDIEEEEEEEYDDDDDDDDDDEEGEEGKEEADWLIATNCQSWLSTRANLEVSAAIAARSFVSAHAAGASALRRS
mgnify:CR=1 FL=1